MGLAAPRKRTKISHDPNNTNWSRSTSGFGHKILSSQGWTPGSVLGARNAAHADMFTAASASHIRVVVKDDNLGLGARAGRDPLGEPTGLDAFKGLLGRLNGKSDVILEAEQKERDDVKLARYAAMKWQEVRFISGGLLVQEKIDPLAPKKPQPDARETDRPDNRVKDKGQEKDRECASDDSTTSDSQAATAKRKSSKRKTSRAKDIDERSESEAKRERKSKKRKHTKKSGDLDAELEQVAGSETDSNVSVKPKDALSPNATTISKERRPMGRHMFRGRHIAQKKRALMDDKSLNEIFMVKS